MSIKSLFAKAAESYLEENAHKIGKKARHMKRDVEHYLLGRHHDNTATVAAALIIGFAVGAVLGVLFAPDKGTEIRGNISGSVKGLGDSVAGKIRQGKEAITGNKEQPASASSTAPAAPANDNRGTNPNTGGNQSLG